MPNHFQQIPPAPPEAKKMTIQGIMPENFLHLQRKAGKSSPHVRVPSREPNTHSGRNRDHRSAFNAAAAKLGGADADINTLIPPGNSITTA
jgi:hypothetical protein